MCFIGKLVSGVVSGCWCGVIGMCCCGWMMWFRGCLCLWLRMSWLVFDLMYGVFVMVIC